MAGGAREEGVGINEGGSARAEYGCVFPSQPQHPTPRGREMIGSECLGKH